MPTCIGRHQLRNPDYLLGSVCQLISICPKVAAHQLDELRRQADDLVRGVSLIPHVAKQGPGEDVDRPCRLPLFDACLTCGLHCLLSSVGARGTRPEMMKQVCRESPGLFAA